MQATSIGMHTTEDLVTELMKRSVAGYIAVWAYDPKSGECYSVEEITGDTRLIRGVIEDAYESNMMFSEHDEDGEAE